MFKIMLIVLFCFISLYANDIALDKLIKLAKNGNVDAQYNLGIMYETGTNVNKDEKKAFMWYKESAVRGYKDAQFNIGVCYKEGIGIEKNEQQAIEWFLKAANQGDIEAKQIIENLKTKNMKQNTININENNKFKLYEYEIKPIIPVTIITKKGAKLCTEDMNCRIVAERTVFTSNAKRGNCYKLSGYVSPKTGWKVYNGNSYILETEVNIRK